MYIYHFRPTLGYQGITLVGTFDSLTKELKVSIARCNKKDQFCKKTGRKIAEERCCKGEYFMKLSFPQITELDTRLFVDTAQFILAYIVFKNKYLSFWN